MLAVMGDRLMYTPYGLLEGVADGGDLGFVDAIEEGKGDGARGYEFGDGEGGCEGEFGVGALQMDGGEVTAAADAGLLEGVDDLIAVGGGEVGGEADDVDEPADAEVGNVEGREG